MFDYLTTTYGLEPWVLPAAAALIVLLIFAIITAHVAHQRGRNSFGWFVLGLISGPIALEIILIALPIHYYIKSGDDDL
ncbi:MAG: hypothetical protein KBI30_02830 [Candidatus Atribacteria bacterium]|nr:hypothetical protein [Candidatus Atribacteria bacterium]